MQIYIASDHAGIEYKALIKEHLEKQGHSIDDLGPYTKDSFDYPDSAHKVAAMMKENNQSYAILICGTGIGMSMTANRYPHIRAGLCTSEFQAKATRAHNNANVLCLGTRVTGEGLALAIVDEFFSNEFEGGRHLKRIEKINLGQ